MGYDSFNNGTPIYQQVIELIKAKIISKDFAPGDKLPSVRELSQMYAINPNTVQKALTELENMRLIYTERTNGKYVVDNDKLIKKIGLSAVRELTKEFCEKISKMGYSKQDIINIINEEVKWWTIF